MIVQTKVVGGSSVLDEERVEVPSGPSTLRQVIEILVRHELAGYTRRRGASQTLRVLTPADLATGVDRGSYGRERRSTPPAPPFDVALARAVEAFEDELYFVFLDGRKVDGLDLPLEIGPESTLRLVRLVALAGG
ncbi:hypothetical protein [Agromyces arachidis]|uniref:hypothetical protein n=1 Tax=Agromyces arachidis TaxID=766966 RepID=UPI0040565918